MAAVTICSDLGTPQNNLCHSFHCFPIYLSWSDGIRCHDLSSLFESCGHCWVFQIWWHIECSMFTASYCRIQNMSTEIPSPPLALFIVTLLKTHLTSDCRMSGSRWVIIPLWLSTLLRSFLYSSSVYSCHLFLISSASVRPYHFCPLLSPSLHEMFLWYLSFFWRDL